jgi:hypothetical protein
MLAVLGLITPLFGVIVLGFALGRFGYLTPGADRLLAEFGFKIAMPALLFRATSTFAPLPTSPVPLLSAYFLASATVWVVVSVLTRHVLGRPTEDAPPIAMASCFGNTVMLGIPLGLIVLGQEAATPAAILVAIETPLLWVIASLHAEWTLRGRKSVSLKVLRDVRASADDLTDLLQHGFHFRRGVLNTWCEPDMRHGIRRDRCDDPSLAQTVHDSTRGKTCDVEGDDSSGEPFRARRMECDVGHRE